MTLTTPKRVAGLLLVGAFAVAACGGGAATPGPGTTEDVLSGDIRLDGSSTVYPVTEAIAEEFQLANPGVRVAVAFSGTGGGFKKFCEGETDANNASRPIKAEEAEICATNNIDPVELKVAIDGLTVVVNPENDWATCMTTAELKLLWNEGSTISRWNEIRPEWPDEPIKLFGPGADSGTFDYFTEAINGKAQVSRSNFTQSEDDNTLVIGVAGDRYALGYFGYAYYIENPGKLKAVEIDEGKGAGCVAPTDETINSGTYHPLSRPLFVYPSKQSLQRPEVAAFFRFFLDDVDKVLGDIGYVALPADQLQASKDALEAALR